MKTIPSHPLFLVSARDRQQLRDAREIMVKRRVKTGHLWQVRESTMKCLRQKDLLRQMLRVKRTELAQFLDQFRGDEMRFAVFWSAMDYPMTHRAQTITPGAFRDPIHQRADRSLVSGAATGLEKLSAWSDGTRSRAQEVNSSIFQKRSLARGQLRRPSLRR